MLDRKASEYPQHLLSCSQTSGGPSQLTFCADRRAPLQSLLHETWIGKPGQPGLLPKCLCPARFARCGADCRKHARVVERSLYRIDHFSRGHRHGTPPPTAELRRGSHPIPSPGRPTIWSSRPVARAHPGSCTLFGMYPLPGSLPKAAVKGRSSSSAPISPQRSASAAARPSTVFRRRPSGSYSAS